MNSSFDNTIASAIKSPRKRCSENTEVGVEDAELEWDFNHHQESGERLRDVGGR